MLRNTAIRIYVMAILAVWSLDALAAGGNQSLGDIGRNVGESSNGLGFMIWMFCLVAGFALVVVGGIQFAGHRKNREGMTNPLLMIGVGSIMMAVTVIIGVMQTTVFGSSDTSAAFQHLDIN